MAWGRALYTPCPFWIRLCQLNFYQKFPKFRRWKLTSIELIWHPVKLIESYKKMHLGGSKVEHFSCFHSSYQWGLNILVFIFRTKFQFCLMCISSSFSLVCKSNNTLHTRFSAGLCTKRNFLCLHCCQRLDSGLDFFLLSSKKNHLIHSVWSI